MSNRLMKHMPNYYKTSQVIKKITDSEDKELQLFEQRLNNTLNQFFVDLADSSLERWEAELGIPVNNSKPAEFRRSVIKSKLRGAGTVTVELIKNVSESYSNGEVDITEDNPNSIFTVTFVGTVGIPPNLDDLKNAIEEIKPAHLGVLYEFIYNTWDDLKTFTWDYLSNNTWEEIKSEVIE